MERYGVETERYLELLYFCRQHDKKKSKLQSMTFLSAVNENGGRSSGIGKPVERMALEAVELAKDIELVEETAIEAAGTAIAPHLLQNVTRKTKYRDLNVPCSEKTFFRMRRTFFLLLDEKKR